MAEFGSIGGDNSPRIPNDPPMDNSAGFVDPYKLSTGVMRGSQTIMNTDGSKMVLGKIPKINAFGIAYYDTAGNLMSTITGSTYSFYDISGNLIQKITGGITYVYDITTGKNVMQIGKLPDGTYGWAVASTGYNVTDGFS